MGKKPKLGELNYLFEKGKDFQLSARLYEEKTGAELPKGNSYLKNSSALARWAEDRNFYIEEINEKPIIERTVILKKKGK